MKRIAFLLTLAITANNILFAQDAVESVDSSSKPKFTPSEVSTLKMASTNQGEPGKLNYKQKVKYAQNTLDAGNYYDAMELYKELNEKKPSDLSLLYNMAESYRLARDYKTAEKFYKKVLDGDASKYPLAKYYYAQMQKMNGDYEGAKKTFNEFTSTQSGSEEVKSQLRHAKVEIDGCDSAIAQANAAAKYKVTHLEAPLNKPRTDFAPYTANENTLYYASINDDSVLNGSLHKSGMLISHIYVANKVNGQWVQGSPVAAPINSDTIHTGYPVITKDGKRMYFTQCGSAQGENEIRCKIYVSTFENGVWTKPKALNEKVNKAESDNTQPSVVQGTDNDTLYFSSNREGGKGGYDIYYSVVNKGGFAAEPVNLGDAVNTEWDERTPHYWSRKGTLFFSSNGHPGFGGFDNFSVKGNGKTWADVKNLGTPVNSSADDLDFTVGEDDKKIFYLVSNRPGIIGLKSETCCDDIFQANYTFIPTIAVTGALKEREDSSSIGPMSGARIEVYDITEGTPRLIKADSVTTSNYFVPVQAEKKYSVKFMKAEHFPQYIEVSTLEMEESDTISKDVTLDKIIKNKNYTLGNIYYEYKSTELTAQSKVTLDTLYSLLMENPSIVIELSSHTDSIASEEYNLKLSQDRAQSCVDYLVSKGIDVNRLIPKGYGESQPIAPNSIGKKDNPEGRAKNRRTQYKVIGELKRKGDKIQFEE
ncbi:MAG: OmpA family protein [Chitinophagales bacterium]|nr:OmpA family protein [Chitinophagales bacterium]